MTEPAAPRSEPVTWNAHPGYEDILYETSPTGIARVTIEKRKPDFSQFKRYP